MRLEGHSLEAAGRALLARTAIVLIAVVVSLVGVIFVALGFAGAVGEQFHSKPVGLLIVGGICLAVGLTAVFVCGRSRRAGRS